MGASAAAALPGGDRLRTVIIKVDSEHFMTWPRSHVPVFGLITVAEVSYGCAGCSANKESLCAPLAGYHSNGGTPNNRHTKFRQDTPLTRLRVYLLVSLERLTGKSVSVQSTNCPDTSSFGNFAFSSSIVDLDMLLKES